MSISYGPQKIKKYVGFALILVLVLLLAYAIGTISIGREKNSSVSVIYPEKSAENIKKPASSLNAAAIKAVKQDQSVVASKKGTKYHLPSCSGAKTIAEENKIVFPNEEAAKKAGYEPAKNCKGLNATE